MTTPEQKGREYRPRGALALEPQAFGFFFDLPDPPEVEVRGDVAIVTVRGPLMHHEDWLFDSYDAIRSRVADALEKKPRAMVLSIDSPGGVVSGCMETSRELRSMAKAAGVPLYSYVDGQACSGGYALACAGERIYTPEAGTLGSIGVIAALVDARQQAAMYGVSVELVTSGERKSDGHPMAGVSDAARAATQRTVDTLAGVFWNVVSESRGMTVDAVRAFQAGVMHGEAAVSAGLADKVATLDELLAEIATGAVSAPQGGPVEDDEKDARASLEKMAEAGSKKAKKALTALDESDGEDDKDADANADGDDAAGDKDKDADASATAARRGSVSAKTAGEIGAAANTLATRVATLEAERENEKRSALLASRKDLAPSLVKVLETKAFAEVKSIVDSIPKPKQPNPAAAASSDVQPTLGKTQVDPSAAPATSGHAADMDRSFGLAASTGGIRREGSKVVFGVMTPQQAAQVAAGKGDSR